MLGHAILFSYYHGAQCLVGQALHAYSEEEVPECGLSIRKEEFDVINPRPGYSTLCSAVLFLFRAMVDQGRADKLFILDACTRALR